MLKTTVKLCFAFFAASLLPFDAPAQNKKDPSGPEAALQTFIQASLANDSKKVYSLLSGKTKSQLNPEIKDAIHQKINWLIKSASVKNSFDALDETEEEREKNKKKKQENPNAKEISQLTAMLQLSDYALYQKAEQYFCSQSTRKDNLLDYLFLSPVNKRMAKYTLIHTKTLQNTAVITIEIIDPAMMKMCKEECGEESKEDSKREKKVQLAKEGNQWKIDLTDALLSKKQHKKNGFERLEEQNPIKKEKANKKFDDLN